MKHLVLISGSFDSKIFHYTAPLRYTETTAKGSVAAAQKSCRNWIKQTIVFIVDSFYCFVSIVSRSIVSIQLD